MVADARLSESCNFENFENKESIEDLTEANRRVRVFLLQYRSVHKRGTPVKPGFFSPR